MGASADEPVTGRKADVIKAAYTAAEAAMRLVKVGNKNWAVTEAVGKIAAAWDCKPVEGVYRLSLNCIRVAQTARRNALVPADTKCD